MRSFCISSESWTFCVLARLANSPWALQEDTSYGYTRYSNGSPESGQLEVRAIRPRLYKSGSTPRAEPRAWNACRILIRLKLCTLMARSYLASLSWVNRSQHTKQSRLRRICFNSLPVLIPITSPPSAKGLQKTSRNSSSEFLTVTIVTG